MTRCTLGADSGRADRPLGDGGQRGAARHPDEDDRALGIRLSIDLLLISASEGLSKSDGLFEKALQRVSCECHEVLYVGDSVKRDVAPTSSLGIASIYVGEDELPGRSTAIRLDLVALARLRHKLAGDGGPAAT